MLLGYFMRIYYVFDIRKEYVDLYRETPGGLYSVLYQLYYMRKKDIEYGFNMFKQLTNKIDNYGIDKDIFLFNLQHLFIFVLNAIPFLCASPADGKII